MQTALDLSKEDLLAMVSDRDRALSERDEKINYLESQLANTSVCSAVLILAADLVIVSSGNAIVSVRYRIVWWLPVQAPVQACRL